MCRHAGLRHDPLMKPTSADKVRALIESRKVNRTGMFVFGIGDRFFGTLTANVHEPYAARYDFTNALAVQMLKSLGPALSPLLDDTGSAPVVASSLRYNDAIRAQSSS